MGQGEAATLALIRECRDHIIDVCSPLGDEEWHRRTALPGWDVQDVVAHLGSLEGFLLGRREPRAATPPESGHVRNPLGALNEGLVDRRRSWPPAAVLAEFRDTSEQRLMALAALTEAELDEQVPSPAGGTVPQRTFIAIRLWDYVVHEHDIDEALGRPLRTDSPATISMLEGLVALFPRAFAKGGGAEGAIGRLDLLDNVASPRTLVAVVRGGRGVVAETAAGEATLHLRASPTAFLRVATGRRDPVAAVAAGEVAATGAADLAPAVLRQLNVIP